MRILKKVLRIVATSIISLTLIYGVLEFLHEPKFQLPYDLGDGYFLKDSGELESLVYISHSDSMVMNHDIMKLNYNSQFIIIEQKPMNQYLEINNPDIRKSQIENCPIRLYWAINKKTDSLYGPYKPGEYKNKFKELGIPDTLELINSNKRKYHNLWYN